MNILDWLLKHPVAIFVIIMGVSSLIKQLSSADRAPPAVGPRPFGGGDPEADERTRRLQEEIRRKIAERRGQSAPPPPLVETEREQESVFTQSDWQEPAGEPSPYKLPETSPPVAVPAVDLVLARQRELAEQLAAYEAQRAAAGRAAEEIAQPAEAGSGSGMRQAGDLHDLRELRNARSLRKVIVLREVLGPPVALR